jgi:hypothetical protein
MKRVKNKIKPDLYDAQNQTRRLAIDILETIHPELEGEAWYEYEDKLTEMLAENIIVPLCWGDGEKGTIQEGRRIYDEEGMREDFEFRLSEVIDKENNN